MIEIIERGTKQIERCVNCGCKFSYEQEDIQRKSNNGPHMSIIQNYIVCPQCGKEIHISSVRGTVKGDEK